MSYDYRKIIKMLDNYIPDGVYNLDRHNFYKNIYHIICSERSIGKTTTFLLMGLLLYKEYGVQTIYMRQTEDMIRPKNTATLFNVILENNYISEITNGEYNGIYQYSRFFYFCTYDETGKRIDTDDTPFCICVALSERYDIKSNFNTPKGDWVIFDEFISNRMARDEFVSFMDILSTIIRERTSARILLLSNTIDVESQYFYDFEISDIVKKMCFGEIEEFVTEKGTKIQIEFPTLDATRRKKKEKHNTLYYGFVNSKLNSITGGGWAFDTYQHPFGDFSVILNRVYIKYKLDMFIKADIVYNKENNKIMVYFHKSTKTYDDSIILTNDTPQNVNEHGIETKIYNKIYSLYCNNLAMYQNNTIGTMIDKFYKM